ncbi:hypothetical protein BBJ28_00000576 [Nothophytophthora sp. Chile5]|nr:hypothetical protein BBJ28_00000576 [Nothophytophthora sp. Chile5]
MWTCDENVHESKREAFDTKAQRAAEISNISGTINVLKCDATTHTDDIDAAAALRNEISSKDRLMLRRMRKYRLYPTDEQRKQLLQFMGTCCYTYNLAVAHFRATNVSKATTLRDLYVTELSKKERVCSEGIGPPPKWVYETPKTFRFNSLRKFETNVKSAFSNKANGNISNFQIQFKEDGKSRAMLSITKTKNISLQCDPGLEISNEIQITNTNGLWYAVIPRFVRPSNYVNRGRTVALDLGVKAFMTGVDLDGNALHVGRETREHLDRYRTRIVEAQQEMALIKNFKGHRSGRQWRAFAKAKRAFNCATDKLNNFVKDMHYQTCAFLTKRYDTIILPIFSSMDMVKKSASRKHTFNSLLLGLKQYQFRKLVQAKCEIMGKSLIIAQKRHCVLIDGCQLTGCTCCVGVLNGTFHAQILADVRRLATEGDYDVKAFALSIKLPSVVLLREYSLLQFLRRDVDNFPRKMPFDVKDVLKVGRSSLIASDISEMLNHAECANGSEFVVLLDIKHDESADEVRQIPAIKVRNSRTQQLEGTRKRHRGPPPVFDGFGAVSRALAALSSMPEAIKSPPERLTTAPHGEATFQREPVYMQGRYLKFQRGLSQTPWVLDGVRMGESSVEECIGDITLPFFRGSGYKFHTAGREDVDVRMLGNGRPFILEILEIRATKSSTKDYFAGLQAGADSKKKTYCCVVWTEGALTPEAIAKLNAIQDLTVQQETPIRVLHRRTLMTRPKIIHEAKCEVLNKHYMLLRLTTSAGTYVKEFVHGDRGRTNPNVASILVRLASDGHNGHVTCGCWVTDSRYPMPIVLMNVGV